MKIVITIFLLMLCSLAGLAQAGKQPDEAFYYSFRKYLRPPEIDIDRSWVHLVYINIDSLGKIDSVRIDDRDSAFRKRVLLTIDKAKTGINWPAGSAHVLLFPVYTTILNLKEGKLVAAPLGKSEVWEWLDLANRKEILCKSFPV